MDKEKAQSLAWEDIPLVERLSSTVTLTKLSVGAMDNNAYYLRSTSGATATPSGRP